MPELQERAETLFKGKTAGVPNLVWVAGGAVGVWFLLSLTGGKATTRRVTGSVATLAGLGSPTAGGVSDATAPRGAAPPTYDTPGALPCNLPSCGPSLPSGGGSIGTLPTPAPTAPVVGPPPPQPAYAGFSVSPTGLTLGTPIVIDVYNVTGAPESIEVWTAPSSGGMPTTGWALRGTVPVTGGRLQVSTNPPIYRSAPFIAVILQLYRGGLVVASGSPNTGAAYDPRLGQTVAVF